MSLAQVSRYDRKLLSWSSGGLLVYSSSFLWAPSRDGLKIVFLFSLLAPLVLLFVKNPKIFYPQNKINFFALLYAAYAGVASLWGNPEDFWHFLFVFFTLLIWLSGVSIIVANKALVEEKYLIYFCLLGAVFAVGSTIYFHLFIKFDNRVWGWNVFRNPNEFGAACGVISIIALAVGMQSKIIKRTYLLFVLSSLCFVGLAASFSRGALLAYIITCVFAVSVLRPKFKVWVPPVICAIVLAGATTIFFDLYRYFQSSTDFSNGRLEIWSLLSIQGDGFWVGKGMSKDTSILVSSLNTVVNHMHNAWLDTFYRTGLLGLILISLHTYYVMRQFSKAPEVFPFYLWFIYGAITMLFDGRTIFWEMGAKWFFYWVPAAFIAAIVCSPSKKAKE